MNRYGKRFGFHTPEMSEVSFNKIVEATKLKWVDNSWHNDTCDSIHLDIEEDDTADKYIEVYFPNTIGEDLCDEDTNQFWVTNENQDELLLTENIDEVIEFINNTINHGKNDNC